MSYVDEVLADSPNGYWRLGEPSGTTMNSEVNNGTMVGAYDNTPTLGVTGALTASGDTDTAVSFASASGECAGVLDTALLDVGDVFTYELWIKRASIDVRMILLAKNDFAQLPGMIYLDAANLIVCRGGGDTVMTSASALTDTASWHHIVWTKNAATNALYLDGSDITPTVTNFTCVDNAQAFNIGSRNGAETFDGAMDEVALYPTALSAARVLAHYVAGTTALQTARPTADSVDGAWTDQAGGTSLAAAIDETSASDSDYIRSELAPSSSGCRVKLDTLQDPLSSANHTIRWRAGKDVTGGDTIDMMVKLYQGGGNSQGGGTLIQSFSRTGVDSFTTYAETLGATEADSITNYADLYLEFYADTA